MRKVQWLAILCTLLLALPFTIAALIALVYLTDYTSGLGGVMTGVVIWDRLALEGSTRWPELAGMVAGQLVILGILLIVRRDKRHDEDSLVDPVEPQRTPSERPVLGHEPPSNPA